MTHCRSSGFLQHAAAALEHRPGDLVSFYLGTSRPPEWQAAVDDACMRAEDAGAAWITAQALLHGVAIALPASEVPEMLAWCERPNLPYDKRLGAYWWYQMARPVFYTWPSLVDHDDGPTVVDHGDVRDSSAPRRARQVGTPLSWATPVIALGG